MNNNKENVQISTNNVNSLELSPNKTNSSEEEKWECGMNVRARFSEDGEYYEAIIEKMFDNEYAVVRYLGYENEEAVKIKELRPSMGESSINEQLRKAAREHETSMELDNSGLDDDEYPDSYKDIDWKVGMSCRALYPSNEVVYEAVVQEVSEKNRTAVVMMIGYGIPFEVSYENMYESMPELRKKQEITAKNNIAEKMQRQNASSTLDSSCQHTQHNDEHDVKVFQAFSHLRPDFSKNKNVSDIPRPEVLNVPRPPSNIANNNSCAFTQCQGILQPQNESDALACLISSNYLSGYYAGYYDCMKKFDRQQNT